MSRGPEKNWLPVTGFGREEIDFDGVASLGTGHAERTPEKNSDTPLAASCD